MLQRVHGRQHLHEVSRGLCSADVRVNHKMNVHFMCCASNLGWCAIMQGPSGERRLC